MKKHLVLIVNVIVLISLFFLSINRNPSQHLDMNDKKDGNIIDLILDKGSIFDGRDTNEDNVIDGNDDTVNEPNDEVGQPEEEKVVITLSDDTTKVYKIAVANPNKTYDIVSSEDTYEDALMKVTNIENDQFIIVYNSEIIYVKYGLVYLKTKTSSVNTLYTVNGVRNYLNGHFADDALFIDTVDNEYKMMISNSIGLVSKTDVKLAPLAYVKSPSYYFVNSFGQLVHAISHSLYVADSYDYSGPIDYAPDYLVKGEKYYSYDGIYFYDDLRKLVDDSRNDSFNQAINANKPHYSYFQYLPIRSQTDYTVTELNKYISYELTRRGLKYSSILSGTGQNFINIQTTYKINAAMELIWAFHESNFGTSTLAKTKYNLFGMNAIDSNPYGNANTFNSLQAGLNYHAEYFIAKQYLNHENILYNGSSLGNKGTGFNVAYASDPYWGEKISGFYFQLDSYLGGKDYHKYELGVTEKPAEIYLQPNESSDILYIETTNKDINRAGLPLIIVGEEDNYYKVKLNAPVVNNVVSYTNVQNYNASVVGYVLKENVSVT